MSAGVGIAVRVRFDHVPAEQREYLVEPGVAGEVRVVEVREAAVAEADVGRHQRETSFVVVTHAVAVGIEEGAGVDVRLPLVQGNFAQVGACTTAQAHRRRQAVDQHVVPLVEYCDSPHAIRQPGQREVPVDVALGEREILAVGVADAHVALGEGKAVVRAAPVQPLIRSAAHALGRDEPSHRIAAVGGADVRVGASADARQARVDDRRIGKADGHVVAGGSVLLEEAWLADAQERVVGLLAIERIGLQPLLTPCDAIGTRGGDHAVATRHQVGHDRLARQRGQCMAVRFDSRAGHDRAGDPGLRRIAGADARDHRNRTRVEVRGRIDGPGQTVRQRIVEHVVGHLPGGITRAAGVVEQDDVEAPEARLVGRQHIDSTPAIVLTVQREVVLEHEHREFRGREGRGLCQHRDRLEGARCARR